MEEKQGWAQEPSEAWLPSDPTPLGFPGATMCPFGQSLFTTIMLLVGGKLVSQPIAQMEEPSLGNVTKM